MTCFVKVTDAIVVTVRVDEVRTAESVCVDRDQADRSGPVRCTRGRLIISVVQAITILITARWQDVASGRLRFDIVSDAIIITVYVNMIIESITISVTRRIGSGNKTFIDI